jgi:tetratricopeptide (TPR) repeat protein
MNSSNQTPAGESSAEALKEEGLLRFNQGDREGALAIFEEAAEAYKGEGDQTGEAEMHNNAGVVHRLNRDWSEALEELQEAEAGFERAGDPKRQGQVLGNMGDLNASMGDKEKAAVSYSQASELLAEAGEGDLQGQVLRAYSLMRLRQRRWIEAIDLMALSIEVRDRPSIGQKAFYRLLQITRKLLGTR